MTTFTHKNDIIRRYVLDYDSNRFFYLSDLALTKFQELTQKTINNNGYDIYHDDPHLIQVIEELGTEKASGINSILKIVNVKKGTIGVVYNPKFPELNLSCDGKKLFKQLSGYDYSNNVQRHDKHLVEVYEKMGDYSCCYPIDFIDIKYIPEDEINTYQIIIENDHEEVIFSDVRKVKINQIYGLYYQKNIFEKILNAISFNEHTLQNMIDEIFDNEYDVSKKDNYIIEKVDIHILNDIRYEDTNDNKYPFIQKAALDDLEIIKNNNFYGFIRNIQKSFPMLIEEKDGNSNNFNLEIYVNEEILIYIDNIANYELLKSIKKFTNCLSENNIIFDKYYIGGIVNKN